MDSQLRLAVLAGLCGVTMLAGCTQCGINDSEAKALVLKELARHALDPNLLSAPLSTTTKCSVSFEYIGPGSKITYVVSDDPIHGLELHKWDHAQH